MGTVARKLGNTAEIVGKIAAQNDYIMFQGANKTPVHDLYQFSSEELIKSFADAGFKDVVLEINSADQKAIDNYCNGRITREQMLHWFESKNKYNNPQLRKHHAAALLNIIDNSYRNGVRLHALGKNNPDVELREIAEDLLRVNPQAKVADMRKVVETVLENAIVNTDKTSLYRDNEDMLAQWNAVVKRFESFGIENDAALDAIVSRLDEIEDAIAAADVELYHEILRRTGGRKTVVLCTSIHGMSKEKAEMVIRYLADYLQKSGRFDMFVITHDEGQLESLGIKNVKSLTAKGIFVIEAAQPVKAQDRSQKVPLGGGMINMNDLPKISVMMCQEVDVAKLGELDIQRDLKLPKVDIGKAQEAGTVVNRS